MNQVFSTEVSVFKRSWFKGLTLALYALVFVSLGVYLHRTFGVAPAGPGGSSSSSSRAGTAAALAPAGGPEENPFIRVAELATPAIVNISTVSSRRRGPSPL